MCPAQFDPQNSRNSHSSQDTVTAKLLQRPQEQSGVPIGDGHVCPHEYTAGRWLKRDKLQRDSRHVGFDFAALSARAVSLCTRARSVVSCYKREGGFNRAFLFTMDSGDRIVARIPTQIAGPKRLTTNSEVATIAYIKSRTKIPVPNILEWNDDSSNSIGSEYIFMDHVPGIQLHSRWDKMSAVDHLNLIKSVSNMIGEMTALDFPAFGSIYFHDAPIDPALKIEFENGFCIGPHCGSVFWNCGVGETDLYRNSGHDQGPWRTLYGYCAGLVASGHSRIPQDDSSVEMPSYWGNVEDHREVLNASEAILAELAKSPLLQDVSKPTLLHADLHMRNIFVSDTEPTNIIALIDWQATAVEPAFVHANKTPDFAMQPFEDGDPDDDADHSQPSQQTKDARQKKKQDILLCHDAFEVCMKGFAPIMGTARSTDETLLRPFRHCNTSWRDSVTAVRHELMELSEQWSGLGLTSACPYSPSEEQLRKHQIQYSDFEIAQSLKLGLVRSLCTDSEGWVSVNDWEVVKAAHDDMYREWLETARAAAAVDGGLSEAKAIDLWPFDRV